ncbi:hypothetical protein QYE76_051205, partial [Lolium multiflorum]
MIPKDMASPINFNQFLEKEKLKSNGSNFTDWFRHVRIFLNGGNLQYVLDAPLGDPPAETETDEVKNVYATRKTRYSQVQCAILCSLEADLQKRFEHHDPHELINELKTIFETHAAVECYEASKHFFSCMMEEGSSVSEHMLAMTGHAKKLSDLGIVIPNRLGINRVLQSLPPSYKNFVMNYNMQNMNKELPELFAMLKSAEIEIKKEHQVLMVNKTTSFKKQGKSKGKNKKSGKKAATTPVKPKSALSLMLSAITARRRDTGSELKNKRRLLKDEVTMRVGNGSKVYVIAVGTLPLHLPSGLVLSLNNCYFVPALSMNIISGSCLMQDGYSFKSENNGCSIFMNNIFYGRAPEKNGLFLLDLDSSDTHIHNIDAKRIKLNDNSTYMWHCRLGHIGVKRMKKLHTDGLLESLDFESLDRCEACLMGKMTKTPFSGMMERATDLLEIIHTDVCGPMSVASRGGYRYVLTFTDDLSRYGYIYLMKHKSETFEKFKEFQSEVENQRNKKIKFLRSDRGGEYLSYEFGMHLKKCGILSQLTPPGTPQRNGVSERRNRTLLDMVRSMMSLTDLPLSFWSYALETAAFTLNRAPSKSVETTPYELWFNKKPKLSFLKVWGCEAYVKKLQPDKLEPKAEKCVFIGYPKETIGAVPEDVPVPPAPATEQANDNDHETSNEITTEPRRSTRERATPDWYDPCRNVMIVDNNDEDPATYEEAMMSPDSNKWQEAMKSEMGSMYDNKVWTLVDLPDSRKAVENKWIFKRKTDADGNITVYKARLVAKGFRQIQGVDYDETFSPVAKLKSVRILLAIAAFFDYEIWQMDVKTAFLNGDIEEELYMVQPKGFVDPKNADKVCKLQRSIYGLKQASRSWNRRFDKVIKDFGFIQCHGEACIYKKVSGSSVAFLILYVDDILLIGNDIELLSSVKGDQELVVTSYTDASWNTDPDDSKSQSGYVFILNGAAVSWASSKQCTVAKSSTESEYIAASEASSEAVWMKRFIVELGVVPSALDPLVIYCDNMGAIANAQEPRSHKRLKHIKLRYHSIREYIEDGEVKICKVHTDLNVADPLTKALPRAKHDQHQNAMGVRINKCIQRVQVSFAHADTKVALTSLACTDMVSEHMIPKDMASPINFNQFLEKEKLKSNGSNFTDWFRHVRIFLNGGNLQYVLDAPLGDPPAETETDEVKNVYATRKTRYSQVQCAILCSLEADLQKRFEHHDPHELINELKTIFETHAAVECYEASKHFFSCMMEEGSSVSEHMLAMTGHAKKLSDLGIVIPNRLGINRVLQSLPPSYKNFVMNYNMQNMNKELPELFAMLKSAEIEIKKEHQVLMVNKTTSFKKQGKSKGKNKKSGKKAATTPVKPKSGPKPDAECYYCKEKGHWKRNCSKYLADLKSGLVKKKKEGISDIHELKNKRRLLKDEVTMRVGNGSKVYVIAVVEDVPVPPAPATEQANDNDHETSNEITTEPRRSTRERATPDWYDPCLNVMIVDNNDEDPATYEEAMMSPDSNKWQEAMKSEMGSMYDNKVWTLVDLPDSRKAVENKWIFKRKTDADGNITVYKARLVAKGFRQIQGVDYDETFSPVAKLKSVRILLAIAAFFDYEIWQMDVKTAFLNGDIEEELYMVQPKGFVDPKNADKVCKLQRSIYGLKQASRSWNRRFDKVIKDFGFIQCHGEACIYKKVSGSSVAFLILYVDDILLIGNDIELLSSVKGYLNNSFSMKDLGEASYILGIKIYRDRSRRLIGLSQSTYLDKILKKFRMDESKKGFLPMLPGKVLSKTQGPATAEERERMSQIPYASAVGSIMYAMLCTRPDIAHDVSLTSRYQSDPGMEHWTAVKNILKYLKRTKDMFLCYGGDQELVVT